jgi:RimJ/RimL family protein N-acetyltransferase
MGNPLQILNATRQQFGWAAAGRRLVDRVGARLFHRHVMEVVWLDLDQVVACQPVPGFEYRFLTADEVHRYSSDPSLDLDISLVEEIDRGESLCFAALERGRVAAYGWYAIQLAAPGHCFGVGIRLPAHVSYMFKGYTHPDYRGRRLHAIVMGLALTALSKRGIRALISTVEWTNEASLRSCDRLGYQRLGRIVQTGGSDRKVAVPAGLHQRTGVEFVAASEWTIPVMRLQPTV